MSDDTTPSRPSLPASDRGGPTEELRVGTVDDLLRSAARGDSDAFGALQDRMAGLVRVNVRRVLRDPLRSEAVTQEVFADVLDDASSFDPDRGSAEAWLLIRAHQRAMDSLGSASAGGAGEATMDQSASGLLT